MKKLISFIPLFSIISLTCCNNVPPVINEYTVKFVNWDDQVLQESIVKEGTLPVYEEDIPHHDTPLEDHEYVYTGWDKPITKVTEDVTYKATFDYVFIFGTYPQTLVSDAELVQHIKDDGEQGPLDYVTYNNINYLKFQSTCDFTADDGTKVKKDDENFYEVKPIRWTILGDENNKFYTTYNLLDTCVYQDLSLSLPTNDDYLNNYENSFIRSWMNSDDETNKGFCWRAFSNQDLEKIATTTVKNDLASTKDVLSQGEEPLYICADTEDKVFCLSREELRDTSLGFEDKDNLNKARVALTTDLVRAMGVATYKKSAIYWTRSPSQNDFCDDDYYVYNVLADGFIVHNHCFEQKRCVRPSIKLQ